MSEQERAELARLTLRQQALQDRLKSWEAMLHGQVNRLQADRQDLDELRRQCGQLQDEQRQLEAQFASLRRQLEAAPAELAPPIAPTPREGIALPIALHASPPVEQPTVRPPPLPSSITPAPPPTVPLRKSAAEAEPPVIIPAILPADPIPEPVSLPAGEPAFAQTAERPSTERPESFELRLGKYWLARVGIVAMLTGMVFLAGLAYKNYAGRIGPGGKVALLYVVSFGLLGVGGWLHRRQETLKNYARVLIAGGLAAVYFTTYAAHHVANLRVIASPALDGALLLVWAGLIVWLADRMKSEVLALFATGLGYYTSVMTSVGSFTLYSNLVLTLAAVFFLVRNRWAMLSSVSLGATYFAYAFWRFYHQGEWRWATPEEGLWQGAFFLMSYWGVFTAAAFLSKHERFAGKHRATFATLNNGAFFGLFLLTMIQVRTGSFWKLALGYGAALLALAWLAAWRLTEEKVTCRAYLTQGLLLVTLALVVYFGGMKLALVLAIESVALLVLARLLDQPIMRIGAFIAAAMSLAWAGASIHAFDRRGLITGAVVGLLMLFNAQWDRRKKEAEEPELPVGVTFFTALAVLAWAFTTWRNAGERWLAIPWAAESVLFLMASRPLGNRALGCGAFLLALLGASAAGLDLLDQNRLEQAARTGMWPSLLAGGLVVFNAWYSRRTLKSEAATALAPGSAIFATLGLLVWLLITWVFVPAEYRAVALAGEAAALTLAGLGLGMIEITILAQGFLVIAQLNCLAHLLPAELAGALDAATRLPWWNPAAVLFVTLGISHGWQRWSLPDKLAGARAACQTVYALAAVFVLLFWLKPLFGPASWMAMTCVLALAVTVYAALTRAWPLAATGQLLLFASVFEFGRQIVFTSAPAPAWHLALVPIAAFAGLPFLAAFWLMRTPQTGDLVSRQLSTARLLYRVMAGLLSLAWIFEYVPARDRCWALILLGGGVFLWAGIRRSREALWASGVFSAIGFSVLWSQAESPLIVYLPNLVAILVAMAQQQAARRRADRFELPEPAHSVAMIVGGCSLGLLVSRWVLLQSGGFYLTVAWAASALVIFAAGFGLRERIYRWLGLAVLGCALGRVVVYDVWKLETLHRILSFMALGAVLLVLGFLYNKYQERIRQWL
jgi:uncharacterized membrane protein